MEAGGTEQPSFSELECSLATSTHLASLASLHWIGFYK